jgi:hypothetical protein
VTNYKNLEMKKKLSYLNHKPLKKAEGWHQLIITKQTVEKWLENGLIDIRYTRCQKKEVLIGSKRKVEK